MDHDNKSLSRRNFMKGAASNAIVLSSIPIGAYSATTSGEDSVSAQPIMPLKMMLKGGIPDEVRAELMKISPGIQFYEDDEAIGEVNTWFGRINNAQFAKASKLQWIQISSAGVEHYLFPKLITSPVLMTNAKGCYAPAIAEHTFGLLFALTRKIASQARNMMNNEWHGEDNMFEMKGKTLGILGLGGIGSQVARRARAMDMQVLAVDIVPKYTEQVGDICEEVKLVQDSGLAWMLPQSDVVVSAAPHTAASEGIFGKAQFDMMKKGTFFINVSRGKLVDTDALVASLRSGHLAGAGLDVTNPEPLPSDHALWSIPNAIVTSHISGKSQHSWQRVLDVFVQNVHRFTQGLPMLNQVDKELGF